MAALPPSPSSLNEKGTAVGVEFKTYQTSAAIIEVGDSPRQCLSARY